MEQKDLKQKNRQRTLYLHIGIPKTASTWLQTEVFPKLDHLLYLGCPRSKLFKIDGNPESRERFVGDIFKRSNLIWKGCGDAIFEQLVGDRQKWLADGRDLLISEEKIGRQGSRPVLLAAHMKELKTTAQKWGFDRLYIIYFTRRQDHWLASHYAQMSDRNKDAGQKDFEMFVQKITSGRLGRYAFGMLLDFDVFYDHMIQVIGEDNLFIMPYESLKKSPDAFLKTLLKKLNTPAKKVKEICQVTSGSIANVRSEPKHNTWRLRHKNSRKGRLSIARWFFRSHSRIIQLTPDISQKIFDSYSTGNQKLSEKANLDLQLHGYFCSDLL